MHPRAPARCSQAAEVFVDRWVWGSVRLMNRSGGRKTLTAADLIATLKMHPCPESMQFFVEELQPAPPPPPPKAKASRGGKDDKKRKGAKQSAATAEPPEAAAEDGEAPPPAKKPRGRPPKAKA
jgi:hypothetical protein